MPTSTLRCPAGWPPVEARRGDHPRHGRAHGTLTVPAAELWWTHDLGAPALYEAAITLLDGKEVVDRTTDRVGLRTIVLDRADDPEGGRVFRLPQPEWPAFPAAWRFAELYEKAPISAIEAARANGEALGLTLAEAGINVDCAPVLGWSK